VILWGLLCSSGTTDGKSKFIPVTGGAREIYFFGKRLVSAMLRKYVDFSSAWLIFSTALRDRHLIMK
jgi:hypothetical protein